MTRLLVTGADGFVGRWMVRAAVAGECRVVAAIQPDHAVPDEWDAGLGGGSIEVVRGDLAAPSGIAAVVAAQPDQVVHLAAVASGSAARQDPERAWRVNADATRALCEGLATCGRPRVLLVSSGEVYGGGHEGPIDENAPAAPVSPYARTKFAGEGAARAVAATGGIELIVARPFPHTGPGQSTQYVLPALAMRLRQAARDGADAVPAGNLDVIRDFLDVRDVVRAYLALLERGTDGAIYNVASGVGQQLSNCFEMLARIIGVTVRVEPDPSLMRPTDIPVLIGDAARLRSGTGWAPVIPFDRTLQEMVNAQAH